MVTYAMHSVVILDNASIHHAGQAVQAIKDTGAIVHFLPPYLPDLNPIEDAFYKVKTGMKLLEKTTAKDIDTGVLSAFTEITEHDCRGWINNSNVYR